MADSVFLTSTERLNILIKELGKNAERNEHDLPGFRHLLEDIVAPDVTVDSAESLRRFMQMFWHSPLDRTYSEVLSLYTKDEQELVRAFVERDEDVKRVGKDFNAPLSLGARSELPVDDVEDGDVLDDDGNFVDAAAGATNGHLRSDFDTLPTTRPELTSTTAAQHVARTTVHEESQKDRPVIVHRNMKFENWGRTVEHVPHLTFVVETSNEIQRIVKYAKKNHMNVRASGYRHSWSPIFGKHGQITISTLGLAKATALPNFDALPEIAELLDKSTELNSIQLVNTPAPGGKRLVRVGTAATNEMLRKWCNQKDAQYPATLPLNIIMGEITFGGGNAPICHGGGRRHPTLSDLVHTIEYVDANGNLQRLDKEKNPEFMRLAGGCFGLLGIVTHLILELDPMSYAYMVPQKLPVMQAIPPPPGMREDEIPEALRISMTPAERAEAQAEFEKHAKDDYYSEWFWFPYTTKVWVNCWNVVEDGAGAVEYPSHVEVYLQWLQTVFVHMVQRFQGFLDLQNLFPWIQATILSKAGLYAMPHVEGPEDAIKTKLPNALHFRRANQNVRVRDLELEIPLQPKKGLLKDAKFDDEIDWALVQRAWWDGILAAYKYRDTCPQRMPLEMRITGPSNIIMAPFRGHNLGTCSIEVITLENMREIWEPYCQYVVDKWMSLKDNQGKHLFTKPHWAKEFHEHAVRGQPMMSYLAEAYKDDIVEFRDVFAQIAKLQGWDVKDARERFSNELFEALLYGSDKGVIVSRFGGSADGKMQRLKDLLLRLLCRK